jgi:hypothetical protein
MTSYSYTSSTTFTLTDAKNIASLVAADLLRFNSFYGKPLESHIDDYEQELIAFLKAGYLASVTYGLRRNGDWVHAIKYHVENGELIGGLDETSGGFRPKKNISDCDFGSYLIKNEEWSRITRDERDRFEKSLPFTRIGASEPQPESGSWSQDKIYGSGGRVLKRWVV